MESEMSCNYNTLYIHCTTSYIYIYKHKNLWLYVDTIENWSYLILTVHLLHNTFSPALHTLNDKTSALKYAQHNIQFANTQIYIIHTSPVTVSAHQNACWFNIPFQCYLTDTQRPGQLSKALESGIFSQSHWAGQQKTGPKQCWVMSLNKLQRIVFEGNSKYTVLKDSILVQTEREVNFRGGLFACKVDGKSISRLFQKCFKKNLHQTQDFFFHSFTNRAQRWRLITWGDWWLLRCHEEKLNTDVVDMSADNSKTDIVHPAVKFWSFRSVQREVGWDAGFLFFSQIQLDLLDVPLCVNMQVTFQVRPCELEGAHGGDRASHPRQLVSADLSGSTSSSWELGIRIPLVTSKGSRILSWFLPKRHQDGFSSACMC